MTATEVTTELAPRRRGDRRRYPSRVGDRVRAAHLAALNELAGLSDPDKVAFLHRLAAELAATGAGLVAHENAPRPAPTAPVPGDAPAGTRVELTVSGYYPLAGGPEEYRFVAGEILTLARPMSAGDGGGVRVESPDGKLASVPHSHLQLAGGV